MPVQSINDRPGLLPGERTPEAQAAWEARIARIGDSLNMPLDPDAIEEETTINVGPLGAKRALRLALEGRMDVLASYPLGDGRIEYHVSVSDADDGEPVCATVTL